MAQETEEIVIGQNIRLSIETNQTLTGASALKFKWRNEDGDSGDVDCTIDDTDDSKMYYDVQTDDFVKAGLYYFWAYVVAFGGKVLIAKDPVAIMIKKEGSV
jgi:hypothetical protein